MISVCIATYNGSAFIIEQIDSILQQIEDADEVIVCDDCSSDDTILKIVNKYGDRVKVYVNNSNLGYILNFEKLIGLASGDIVFLSDQDDLWADGRVRVMLERLENKKVDIVVGGLQCFDSSTRETIPFPIPFVDGKVNSLVSFFNMILGRVAYYGSCMAFKKKVLNYYTPFPVKEVSHDHWLAIVGNYYGVIEHIGRPVTLRRIHSDNITNPKRRVFDKIKTRILWVKALYVYLSK